MRKSPVGVQAPTEPLELSIMGHLMVWAACSWKAPWGEGRYPRGGAWLKDSMVNHLKRVTLREMWTLTHLA